MPRLDYYSPRSLMGSPANFIARRFFRPLPFGARLFTKGVICSTLALTAGGCEGAKAQDQEVEKARDVSKTQPDLTGTRVEVAIVSPSLGKFTLRVPGEVEGMRDAELASPRGGYIEQVAVKEGQEVKKGAVLARVDTRTHSTRLVRAQVERKAALRELERTKILGKAVAAAELDAAKDRVDSAKAALNELQVAAGRSVIVAPFSGTIVQVEAEVGEVAAPGIPLFRLVQLEPIRVSVALSDRDMALAHEGMPARVSLAARSGIYEGKVVQLSKAANLKTRSFEALVEVANKNKDLLPGMIAQVSLATDHKAGKKLLISQDWLVTRPTGNGVFLEDNGKAVWKPVELGTVLRRQVEVKSGLQTGDRLIIVGHRSLAEGDRVLVHRTGTCCTKGRAVFDKSAPSSASK